MLTRENRAKCTEKWHQKEKRRNECATTSKKKKVDQEEWAGRGEDEGAEHYTGVKVRKREKECGRMATEKETQAEMWGDE